MFSRTLLTGVLALAACLSGTPPSRAEAWPTLEAYVAKCVLIVKAKTVVEKEDALSFQVLESWKGKYDPKLFVRTTPDGRFFANKDEHGVVNVSDGQEIVFFFSRHNQPVEGKLTSHSTAFPVRSGKVIYASTSGPAPEGLRKEYTLEEFKKAIQAAASETDGSRAPGKGTGGKPRDLSGSWRVFLPAGFEHTVTLTLVEGNVYRLQPGSLTFSGLYEVRGDGFILVQPSQPRLKGFEWKIRSPYLITLVEQPSNTGANYLGAVLFRPAERRETAK